MRSGPLLIVVVMATVAALVVNTRERHDPSSERSGRVVGQHLISDVTSYHDEDYGFSLAVPVGWRSIVAVSEPSDDPDDIGYTIGFEAPRDGPDDVFADYVMIEILPGSESGRFETDGSRARAIRIDGLDGIREELAIDAHEIGDATLDLIVYQAEVRGVGYTVGFYAIGEPERRDLLTDAFELMVHTFELHLPPFRVS